MVVADAVKASPVSFDSTVGIGEAPTPRNISHISAKNHLVPSGQDKKARGLMSPGVTINQR